MCRIELDLLSRRRARTLRLSPCSPRSIADPSRIRHHKRVIKKENPARWPLIAVVGLSVFTAAIIVSWVLNARAFNHWLGVHTGATNESGPYYGFWSGFGSDIAEFGILGAIATAIYQLVKKYNCHEPGCWRVGTHPAAGGQFLLCYRHHPDFHGTKPTHDLIVRMHQEHEQRQAAIHDKLHEIHEHMGTRATDNESGVNAVTGEHPVNNAGQ